MLSSPLEVATPKRVGSAYGLLSAVEQRSPSDRWEAGVQWPTLEGTLGAFGDLDCNNAEGADGLPLTFKNGAGFREEDSIINVWAAVSCTPLGITETELVARSKEKLELSKERILEQYLWQRFETESPRLLTTQPTFMSTALGIAEQWAYEVYGCQGTIHVPMWALYSLNDDIVVPDGSGPITTALGTPIVAGTGYPLPNGGSSLPIYVTGPMVAYHSPLNNQFGTKMFDPRNNDLTAITDQSWLLGWDSPASEEVYGRINVSVSSALNMATSTTTTSTTV